MLFAIRISALLALLFLSRLAIAEEFFYYNPKHRTPEELIKVAEPLLRGRAIFSVANGRVIIASEESSAKAAIKLFTELDRKPRLFQISLRRKTNRDAENSAVTAGISSGRVRVHARDSAIATNAADRESVRVLEGGEALLSTGNSFFPSGIWVRPRLAGKKSVELEIYTRKDKVAEAETARTTVSVSLGRWASIGGYSRKNESRKSEILGSESGRDESEGELQVLVEEVR